MVEHLTVNQGVPGSSPGRGATHARTGVRRRSFFLSRDPVSGSAIMRIPKDTQGDSPMMQATEHLYIVTDDQILHGEPIIRGTRTPVRAIVELWRLGIAIEEIPRR